MKRFSIIVVLVVSLLVSLVHQASAQEAEAAPTKESVLQRLNEAQLTLDREGWVSAVKELNKLNGKEESEEAIQQRADSFFGNRSEVTASTEKEAEVTEKAVDTVEVSTTAVTTETPEAELNLVDISYSGIIFEFFKLGICVFSATIGTSCLMHFVKYVCPFYVTLSIAGEVIIMLYIVIQCFAFWATYQTPEGCTASLFVTLCMCSGAGKFLYIGFIRPFLP